MNSDHLQRLETFNEAIRLRQFGEARAMLAMLEQDTSFWQPLAVSKRTELFIAEGHFDEGLQLLSDYIVSGNDLILGCLNRRAGIYFEYCFFKKARPDYQTILDSDVPHAVTYFHSTAAFRIAWMLALEGDPKFEAYLNRCPDKDGDFFFDRLVGPQDVRDLYEKQRARRKG